MKTQESLGELLGSRGEAAGVEEEILVAVEERRPPGALQPGQPQEGHHQGSLGLLRDGEGRTVAAVPGLEVIFPVGCEEKG